MKKKEIDLSFKDRPFKAVLKDGYFDIEAYLLATMILCCTINVGLVIGVMFFFNQITVAHLLCTIWLLIATALCFSCLKGFRKMMLVLKTVRIEIKA